jgi:hypothetical protein
MQYPCSWVSSSAIDLYLHKMSIRNMLNKHALWYAGHSTFSVSNTWQVVWQRQTVWSCAALSKSHTVFQTGHGHNQASSSMSTLEAADTSRTWPVPLCVVVDLQEILHLTRNMNWEKYPMRYINVRQVRTGGAYTGTRRVQHLSHNMTELHDPPPIISQWKFLQINNFFTCPPKNVTDNSDHAMTHVITHQYLSTIECQYHYWQCTAETCYGWVNMTAY